MMYKIVQANEGYIFKNLPLVLEAGKSLSLRLAWSSQRVPGQPQTKKQANIPQHLSFNIEDVTNT